MFAPLPAQFSFPEAEKRVLEFWQRHGIFQQSLDRRRGGPRFVFYEGPPTANGLPHPGHCLTRAMKDLFPRYRTMCGYLVERKAGWDTHGLPVEVEVCKELGIHTKEEIEAYGVARFVRRCIESVFRYTREWEEMTRRLGFWINLDEAYVTYHQSYVESVWWSLKTLFQRGLLYQGHKVVWWWAQGGTALSAGEVGEGYRTVRDPSVYVKFPLVGAAGSGQRAAISNQQSAISGQQSAISNQRSAGSGERAAVGRPHDALPPGAKVALLVWTTTPWTLISNHFAAVGPDVDYALVRDPTSGEHFYIASALVGDVARKLKRDFVGVGVCKGRDLVGLRYEPPFDCYAAALGQRTATRPDGGAEPVAWRIVPADFIDLATGTGIVHIAPAFGEVDFNLLQDERARFAGSDAIPLICSVRPDGTMNDEAPPAYRGRWVKDCDADIIRELRARGVLLHEELIEHEYPFCPRSEDDPLIQYARRSWFVRTSRFKEEFLRNNAAITWLPEHIRDGRFGDFLRNNVDWALSRERYWGTPLPIWVCEQTGRMEAVGSYAELLAKRGVQGTEVWETAKKADPALPDHLKVHKPYIDEVTYASPFAPGARMRRVPEVIDCWWDAGSMPFAQWGFPHATGSSETFAERFPADFISEAIDQTRGWFYGLLAISTLLFGPAAADQASERAAGKSADERRAGAEQRLRELGKTDTGDRVRAARQPAARPPGREATASSICLRDDGQVEFLGHWAGYPHPYRTCIVLGHVMGEDGLKMSKRAKNYREPAYIFDTYGADAMRWFFFSAQTPWTSIRFQEANIRDAQRELLVRLYNVFSFFNIYANIDGFVPDAGPGVDGPAGQGAEGARGTAERAASAARPAPADDATRAHVPAPPRPRATGWRPVPQRSELDRWIISELHRTIRFVREKMDAFENYPAAGRLNEFVGTLSNWYVRRARERFWRAVQGGGPPAHSAGARSHVPPSPPSPADQDKWDAYNTLYEVLLTLSKLLAPFTPFFAEVMYQNLAGGPGLAGPGGQEAQQAPDPSAPRSPGPPTPRTLEPSAPPLSVHLCDYPVADEALIDEQLAAEMDLVRDIVSLGRAARTAARLKVRQPLARVEIILARREHTDWLRAHSGLIADELNIRQVEFATEADHYVQYQVRPDFKAIGPKFGRLAPKVAAALQQLDPAEARRALAAGGELILRIEDQELRLTEREVQVRLEARPGWSAAQGRAGVVVVKTELTPDLIEEGLIRELIHHVQGLRREQSLAYEARITLYIDAPAALRGVIERFSDLVRQECLAADIVFEPPPAAALHDVRIEQHTARLAIQTRG